MEFITRPAASHLQSTLQSLEGIQAIGHLSHSVTKSSVRKQGAILQSQHRRHTELAQFYQGPSLRPRFSLYVKLLSGTQQLHGPRQRY